MSTSLVSPNEWKTITGNKAETLVTPTVHSCLVVAVYSPKTSNINLAHFYAYDEKGNFSSIDEYLKDIKSHFDPADAIITVVGGSPDIMGDESGVTINSRKCLQYIKGGLQQGGFRIAYEDTLVANRMFDVSLNSAGKLQITSGYGEVNGIKGSHQEKSFSVRHPENKESFRTRLDFGNSSGLQVSYAGIFPKIAPGLPKM